MPFSSLEANELEETLREGSFLLQNLEIYMEENENILKMIRQMETEVNRINELLYIILMLKHQAFKPNHWTVTVNFRYFLLKLSYLENMGRNVSFCGKKA